MNIKIICVNERGNYYSGSAVFFVDMSKLDPNNKYQNEYLKVINKALRSRDKMASTPVENTISCGYVTRDPCVKLPHMVTGYVDIFYD